MKYSKNLSTRSFYINRYGRLSTSFLFYQMQDLAWEHAHVLGLGYEQLKQEQQFWVLSRLWVKISRRPVWGEDFTLETWSRGTDGFFAYRDYQFLDGKGHIITQATSSWLVLDVRTKRIVRLTDFKNFPTYGESVFGENAHRIRSPKSDAEPVFTPVRFNEIDINQHFTTGRYLERILDSYDFAFHEAYELIELEINLSREGLPGDYLAVRKEVTDPLSHLCSVVRHSDGADLARARLGWAPRR
jgi:medium-chain acyl-[acyl-carrier-protein] hydrolase